MSKKIIFLIFLVLCVVLLVIFSLSRIPFYKVSDRTKHVNEEAKKRTEKVEGWIRVQGTNIDYPIIYNDYFGQTKISDITYDFAWTNREVTKLTNRPLIVGHNILNVSANPLITSEDHARFEQLMSFVYPDFVQKNKYIQYTIGGKNYLYKIFAVAFESDADIDYYTEEYDKKEMSKYVDNSIKNSLFKFDIDVNADDKVITLVTCTRMFGPTADKAFKIDARMVRKGERISNYRIEENKAYKKIKKIMEGEKENETEA